jgi:hypothetical protein
MEGLLNKLTEEQKTELGNLCQKINDIFEENDSFTEDDVDKYAGTLLQKGIYQVMNELGLWCTI